MRLVKALTSSILIEEASLGETRRGKSFFLGGGECPQVTDEVQASSFRDNSASLPYCLHAHNTCSASRNSDLVQASSLSSFPSLILS